MIEKKYFKMRNGEYYTKFTKEEIASKVDRTNPETFIPFLEEMDYPYIEYIWNDRIKCPPGRESTHFSRYIVYMNLMSFRLYHYEDGFQVNELMKAYSIGVRYKECGCYCKRWEPVCDLFNPQTKECVYTRNSKKLCNDCLYTDEEIKKIKENKK